MPWSHFILSGLNYYVLKKISTMYLLCSYCIAKHLLLLWWDTGKVKDRFGGMGRFKGGLRCEGWVNSVIINVNTLQM